MNPKRSGVILWGLASTLAALVGACASSRGSGSTTPAPAVAFTQPSALNVASAASVSSNTSPVGSTTFDTAAASSISAAQSIESALATVAADVPAEYREVAVWAREQGELRETKECGGGAEISVDKPLQGRFESPDRIDVAYPLYCEHRYTVGFGGPLGTPGESDYQEFSQSVEMSDGALYVVLLSDGKRSLHGPLCKPSRGYESLVTCTLEDKVIPGDREFLDLLLMLEGEASDAGDGVVITPVHFSNVVAAPELRLPDDRRINGFNSKPNRPALGIDKNVISLDVQVSCDKPDRDCSLSKRYRVRYERGELQVKEVGK